MVSVRFAMALLVSSLLAGSCASSEGSAPKASDRQETTAPEDDTTDEAESQGPSHLEEGYPLNPGRYETARFGPPFSFRIPSTSWIGDFDRPGVVALFYTNPDWRADLVFMNVDRVYDPQTMKVTKAPEDLLSYIERNPYLKVLGSGKTTIGKISAPYVDVVVDHLPKGKLPECDQVDCVPLVDTGTFAFSLSAKGRDVDGARIIEVDVAGTDVLISVAALLHKGHFMSGAPTLKEVRKDADKILKSVAF